MAASDNAVYVAGYLTNGTNGGNDVLILKYDEAGNLLWSRVGGGNADDIARGVAVCGNNIYVVGETASFGAGGKDAFLLQMDANNGTATLPFFVAGNLAVGIRSIGVGFGGDAVYPPSAGTGKLTVAAADTSVSVSGNSGSAGQTITLSVTLYRTTDNAVLPRSSLSFYVDNAYVGTVNTDGTATAQVSYSLPSNLSVGTQQTITVKRLANAQYNASTGTATLTATASP